MSYDFALCADVGADEPARLADADYLNYTSNVAPMWRQAMPETNGLLGLNGMQCRDALPHLLAGGAYMDAHAQELKALNPSNGWGDYHGARRIVAQLTEWAQLYPLAVFEVSN